MRREDGNTPRSQRALRSIVVAVWMVAAPRVALACPVCFGQSDSPLALGINYGILAMLGFIGSLLLAFASFFIYLVRRARLVESGAVTAPSAPRHGVSHAQEGTI